jgi:hypothetical protein
LVQSSILLRKKMQCWPICLLNVSFKVFTRIGTNVATSMALEVIIPTQTAFTISRRIVEEVIIHHETMHEAHRQESGRAEGWPPWTLGR